MTGRQRLLWWFFVALVFAVPACCCLYEPPVYSRTGPPEPTLFQRIRGYLHL